MPREDDFEKGVFINCPFDDEYRSLLRPLLFTIIYVETVGLKGVAAPSRIWYSFIEFMSDFYDKREAEGFSKDDLAWMPVGEFMDFIREWLAESDFPSM